MPYDLTTLSERPVPHEVTLVLRDLRYNRGKRKAAALAYDLAINDSTLSDIENENIRVTLLILERYEAVYGCPMTIQLAVAQIAQAAADGNSGKLIALADTLEVLVNRIRCKPLDPAKNAPPALTAYARDLDGDDRTYKIIDHLMCYIAIADTNHETAVAAYKNPELIAAYRNTPGRSGD